MQTSSLGNRVDQSRRVFASIAPSSTPRICFYLREGEKERDRDRSLSSCTTPSPSLPCMRQSTLLFGQGERESGIEGAVEDGQRPPPSKRARRPAANRSEERSKRQMQMTLDQGGALNRTGSDEATQEPEQECIIVDDEGDSTDGEGRQGTSAKAAGPRRVQVEPMSLSVKGNFSQGEPSTAHSFFTKRQPTSTVWPAEKKSGNSFKAAGPVKPKWPLQREAPWPDAGCIHVQPEEAAAEWMLPHLTRSRSPLPSGSYGLDEQDLVYPWGSPGQGQGSSSSSTYVLGRRVQRSDKATEGGLWVDQWRPTKAAEVLGNESRAEYLRNWLQELQVKAVLAGEVRRVERRKKKPRKGALHGFIVDDEEEEEAWFNQFRKPESSSMVDDLEIEALGAPESYDSAATEDHLANAIVLCGPTGVGKTAAVYACAAELGFEVFELYPGVGRRSGKDVSQAVGDLGRNHMVSSGGAGGGARWKGSKMAKEAETEGQGPRQSLILLEEVDLLYEDDKGFWSAVVDLISESRRPVVMTCNDLSCVPLDELPVQQVLQFQAPLEDQAVPYLQAMALRHGRPVSSAVIHRLYASTTGESAVQWATSRLAVPASGPLHPSTMLASVDKDTGVRSSSLDLRHAIMQLQFLSLLTDEEGEEDRTVTLRSQGLLREEIKRAEEKSLADATFSQPFDRASEDLEPDEYGSSVNEVQGQGTILLYKPRVKMEAVAMASECAEERYLAALISPSFSSDCMAQDDQERQRASSRVDELLKALFIHPSSRVPSWESVVDYAPLVGNMIAADDEEEAAHQQRLTELLEECQSGSFDAATSSLLKAGIRPSRHASRLLLQRDSNGLLATCRREADFTRWILIDSHHFVAARKSRLGSM